MLSCGFMPRRTVCWMSMDAEKCRSSWGAADVGVPAGRIGPFTGAWAARPTSYAKTRRSTAAKPSASVTKPAWPPGKSISGVPRRSASAAAVR